MVQLAACTACKCPRLTAPMACCARSAPYLQSSKGGEGGGSGGGGGGEGGLFGGDGLGKPSGGVTKVYGGGGRSGKVQVCGGGRRG